MKTIVAVDKNWGIGKNNDLLFHLKEDMSFFKKMTLGKVIVMGSNTLMSLPGCKPLKKQNKHRAFPRWRKKTRLHSRGFSGRAY